MRKGKATEGLVQHSISISGAEVYIIKIFGSCSFCYIYKDLLSQSPPTEIPNRYRQCWMMHNFGSFKVIGRLFTDELLSDFVRHFKDSSFINFCDWTVQLPTFRKNITTDKHLTSTVTVRQVRILKNQYD